MELQRGARSGGAPPPAESETTAGIRNVLRDNGISLEPAVRREMEPKFGADFSAVQVHTGARAAQSARSVNALAYTVGEHIVFGDGQFSSHTEGLGGESSPTS